MENLFRQRFSNARRNHRLLPSQATPYSFFVTVFSAIDTGCFLFQKDPHDCTGNFVSPITQRIMYSWLNNLRALLKVPSDSITEQSASKVSGPSLENIRIPQLRSSSNKIRWCSKIRAHSPVTAIDRMLWGILGSCKFGYRYKVDLISGKVCIYWLLFYSVITFDRLQKITIDFFHKSLPQFNIWLDCTFSRRLWSENGWEIILSFSKL